VRPVHLRHLQVQLQPAHRIPVERGDVLALYHPGYNPIGWTSVPCAPGHDGSFISHRRRVAMGANTAAGGRKLAAGDTFEFRAASLTSDGPCRQYSLVALFGIYTLNYSHFWFE